MPKSVFACTHSRIYNTITISWDEAHDASCFMLSCNALRVRWSSGEMIHSEDIINVTIHINRCATIVNTFFLSKHN